MRRDHFATEMHRLASGFSHRLGPERLDALWRKFRNHDESVVTDAVNDLLTGSRFPGREELAKAFEVHAEIGRERARVALGNTRDAEFQASWDSGTVCPATRARFYLAVWRFLWSDNEWPSWSRVEAWIAAQTFEDPPADWMAFIAGAWAQLPPGTPAGGTVSAVRNALNPSIQRYGDRYVGLAPGGEVGE